MEYFSLIFASGWNKSCSKLGAIFGPCVCAIFALEKFGIQGHYLKLFGMRQVASLLFSKLRQSILSTCVNGCSRLHQAAVLVPRMSVQIPLCWKKFPGSLRDLPSDQDESHLLESNLNIDDLPAGEELKVKIVIVNWCGKVTTRIPGSRQGKQPDLCVHAGHAEMNIPDLIKGLITWQSTLPCRASQETPFVDEGVFQNRGFAILGDPGGDSRGEKQINQRNRCEQTPGASEDGRKSPWEHTFNKGVQEPICVLAFDWARILRQCIFCPQ